MNSPRIDNGEPRETRIRWNGHVVLFFAFRDCHRMDEDERPKDEVKGYEEDV